MSKEIFYEASISSAKKENNQHLEDLASTSILMVTVRDVELPPEPIPSEWVVSGTPTAHCRKMVRSDDRTSHIVIWECTQGVFKWHYDMDEAIVVISGEAVMIDDDGREWPFRAGDLGFFRAGTSCTWRIETTLRKIGVLREPIWRPLGLGLKAWHKLLRMLGLSRNSPLL